MQIRTKSIIAMTLFCGVCLIPSVGMLFTEREAVMGNQMLSPPPTVFTGDGSLNGALAEEITKYTADHFAFRRQLITANALLTRGVFGESSEPQVTAGDGDWLFYQETMDDVLHRNTMTPRQLYSAARCLALMREYADKRGAKMVFTVAPNKASLYPDYLPAMGRALEGQSSIDALLPFLRRENIVYADLFSVFREKEEVLYFHTDSHWNKRGAALAHDTLSDCLGREGDTRWYHLPFETERVHRGDLYEMLYPAGICLEDDICWAQETTFQYVKEPRSAEDQRIETVHPGKTEKLLMFRDSFGSNLYPLMAEDYSSALFSRAMPYTMELLDETGSDIVIVEIVERNLPWLALRAPVMAAPERTMPRFAAAGDGTARLCVEDSGAYRCWTGAFSGMIDDTSPIYLQLDEKVVEASPAGDGEGAPFTAYVRPEDGAVSHVFYRFNDAWHVVSARVQE